MWAVLGQERQRLAQTLLQRQNKELQGVDEAVPVPVLLYYGLAHGSGAEFTDTLLQRLPGQFGFLHNARSFDKTWLCSIAGRSPYRIPQRGPNCRCPPRCPCRYTGTCWQFPEPFLVLSPASLRGPAHAWLIYRPGGQAWLACQLSLIMLEAIGAMTAPGVFGFVLLMLWLQFFDVKLGK